MDSNQLNERQQMLMDVKDRVFTEWIEQIRIHISKARKLPEPLLIDTLPAFYDTLVHIATSCLPTYQRSTLAMEHGGERARLTHFDTQSIVQEFQLFRRVMFSTWGEIRISLSLTEIAAVNHAVDEAIAESISGFVMIEERFREQFFSALAHDMRTPLATASMAVEMIGKSDDIARIRTMAEIASRQHQVLSQMIVDLLDTVVAVASMDDSPQFQQVDMYVVAKEVAQAAQLTSSRPVIVEGKSILGMWDATAIRRALENLVNNAVKYGKGDTNVTISLVEFHGRCLVSVVNAGAPIPVHQQERIFQLFRRSEHAVQNNTTGWGIGLPYVRSVAEHHGGSVGVDSNDTTTTFVFDIPLDPRAVLNIKE